MVATELGLGLPWGERAEQGESEEEGSTAQEGASLTTRGEGGPAVRSTSTAAWRGSAIAVATVAMILFQKTPRQLFPFFVLFL